MHPFPLVIVRGGGDLATGAAHSLFRCGFPVTVLELAEPRVIRRTVSLAEAQYTGEWSVEGVTARSCDEPHFATDYIPVLTDPDGAAIRALKPAIVVDARIMKRNVDTRIDDAPLVIALGPGYRAGVDAHAVIETQRGHHLGRVYLEGEAIADTGVPGEVGGYTHRRVLRAPAAGLFAAHVDIGAIVETGQVLGAIGDTALTAPIPGLLRGLLHPGLHVSAGEKIGDIDPRPDAGYTTISDKARAVAGGVLEAILTFRAAWSRP